MARRQKRVDTVIRRFQQAAQRGNKRDVLAEKVKVSDVAGFRLLEGNGGGGHGGFKTQPEKDDLTLRISHRQRQGIHR